MQDEVLNQDGMWDKENFEKGKWYKEHNGETILKAEHDGYMQDFTRSHRT